MGRGRIRLGKGTVKINKSWPHIKTYPRQNEGIFTLLILQQNEFLCPVCLATGVYY